MKTPAAAPRHSIVPATIGRILTRANATSTLTWTRRVVLSLSVWQRGLVVMRIMLTNIGAALVWTWLLVWICSYGNIVSGLPTKRQSYGVFMSGTMMWIQLSFCLLTILGQSALLAKNQFLVGPHPDTPAGLAFCFLLLLRRTFILLVLSVVTPMAMDLATDSMSPSVRRVRIEFYVNCVLSAGYLTALHLVRRRIFFTETVEGIAQRQSSLRSSGRRHQQRMRMVRICRVFLMQNLPLLFSTFIAGIFVQFTSSLHVTNQQGLMFYSAGSLGFKLVLQELARAVISSRKSTKDTRTIFLTVGLPTVLIDTQIRLAMQRLNSVNVTISGAVILSLIEVVSRVAKVLYLRYEFRRYDTRMLRNRRRGSVSPVSNHLEESERTAWRQLHLRYHASEVYADMAAEYIAIGSCAAMIYFYWDHPHYRLGGLLDNEEPITQLNRPIMWVLQVGLEIVVDYVSVVMELAGGIPFEDLHSYRPYITLLFLIIALLNVQNSAMFFLI